MIMDATQHCRKRRAAGRESRGRAELGYLTRGHGGDGRSWGAHREAASLIVAPALEGSCNGSSLEVSNTGNLGSTQHHGRCVQ